MQHSPNLFAAPQCLGYRNEHGNATPNLCLPSEEAIIKKLKRVIKATGATSVFVASDNDFMIGRLTSALKKMKVSVASGCFGMLLCCVVFLIQQTIDKIDAVLYS